MTTRNQITSWADATKFMLAGNATFTLVSKKTGARFTYRVRYAEDYNPAAPAPVGKVIAFVSLLTGSDNENAYSYFGQFRVGKGFDVGAKSKVPADAPSVRGFQWFYKAMITKEVIETGKVPEAVEFWHEGKCCRCGRKLTVPSSIESGIGPECATKHSFVAEAA
jgi:hypothetical protein